MWISQLCQEQFAFSHQVFFQAIYCYCKETASFKTFYFLGFDFNTRVIHISVKLTSPVTLSQELLLRICNLVFCFVFKTLVPVLSLGNTEHEWF